MKPTRFKSFTLPPAGEDAPPLISADPDGRPVYLIARAPGSVLLTVVAGSTANVQAGTEGTVNPGVYRTSQITDQSSDILVLAPGQRLFGAAQGVNRVSLARMEMYFDPSMRLKKPGEGGRVFTTVLRAGQEPLVIARGGAVPTRVLVRNLATAGGRHLSISDDFEAIAVDPTDGYRLPAANPSQRDAFILAPEQPLYGVVAAGVATVPVSTLSYEAVNEDWILEV